ncbi:class I SAM-dependent methyltransferase [Actinophytocola sp.]|uniref:class I SAM-dependent methyltransferase n=1 Tax=Actinophytocola sp. TaxID=1872138 RepID=UPI00389994EA
MITTTTDGYPLPDRGQDWPPLPEQRLRPMHQAMLAALGRVDGKRLLDVGCGVGLLLRAAERRGALVAGTDAAVARLEIARWALPDADLRLAGPSEALPFDSGTFDVVTARATSEGVVLTELARVVRPGGLVAVGSWVRSSGCWAETFAGHLRRLGLLPPATGTDGGLDGALRSAGLTVRGGGDVRCTATFPSVAAAWSAMLRGEDMQRAVRLVGEVPVREAFAGSVAPATTVTGAVLLTKTFGYAVAAAPVSTMWAPVDRLDNESGSVSDRTMGRD